MIAFDEEVINRILEKKIDAIAKIKELSELLGKERLPQYLITYIEGFLPSGADSVAMHHPQSIARTKDIPGETDRASIIRTRGFMSKNSLELDKFPNAIHHIRIIYNHIGKARIFYKYEGNIRFLKTSKK